MRLWSVDIATHKPVLGITGGSGFLAWHLRARAHALGTVQILVAERDMFYDSAALLSFVRACDTIVHLAGMNRGNEHQIEKINIDLCGQLAHACAASGRGNLVIFANSTHALRDTAYGRSKRYCAEQFAAAATRGKFHFLNLVLPQIFGECGQPFYNSVVATFCHQIAVGESPSVIEDQDIELVHAQDFASLILDIATAHRDGEFRLAGHQISVSGLLTRLQSIAGSYNDLLIPRFDSEFDLSLFNTYRSYRFPAYYPVDIGLRSDARGNLFEAVRSLHGGQCFLSTTKPGYTRGNHYHLRKLERFLVVSGEALIQVRRLFSEHLVEFRVSGAHPAYIDMPTMHTHNITNIGSGELITLFWAHEIFDAARTDTYPEPVAA